MFLFNIYKKAKIRQTKNLNDKFYVGAETRPDTPLPNCC